MSFLAENLSLLGDEVRVWTAQDEPMESQEFSTFIVHGGRRRWGYRAYSDLTEALDYYDPEWILVEYAPYLYQRSAWNPMFALWLLRLRLKKRRIALIVHEYPSPSLSLAARSTWLKLPQYFHFQLLLRLCDQMIFLGEAGCTQYTRKRPERKGDFSWIPAGSMIPEVEAPTMAEAHSESLYSGFELEEREPTRADDDATQWDLDNKVVLLQLVSSQSTRQYRHTLAALEHVLVKLGQSKTCYLYVCGIEDDQVLQQLDHHGKSHLKSWVTGLGDIDHQTTSQWLQRADVVLAPYQEGVSTRRTSIMAALAHGKPVVTLKSVATEANIPWEEFVILVNGRRAEDFGQAVAALILNPQLAQKVSWRAKAKFHESFSWPVIARAVRARLD